VARYRAIFLSQKAIDQTHNRLSAA